MAKKDDRVRVRIKPLHGIGGVGEAGDVVFMSKEDADSYIQQGYVEVVEDEAAPAVIQSEVVPVEEKAAEEKAEVQTVMKPETKRSRGKGKK